MKWYLTVLRKYTQFSGRARRMEYWMFNLINFIILCVLAFAGGAGMMDTLASGGTPSFGIGTVVYLLYALFTLIPSSAVAVRRLHDTSRSGWWILIGLFPVIGGIVLLVFLFLDSTPGDNEYGPNPKAVQSY